MSRSARGRALAFAFVAPVLVALSFPLAASGAALANFTLYMKVGECFSGTGPPNLQATVVWRSASAAVKASFSTMSDPTFGKFYPPDASCEMQRVEVGDRIKVTFAAISLTRTFVVPPLSIKLDRATNVLRGAAPANDTVHVQVSRPPLGGVGFPLFYCEGDVATGATPHYQIDATALIDGACPASWDPIGGDSVVLFWKSQHGDGVLLEGYAHFIRVVIGSPKVAGAVDVGQGVSMELLGPGGSVRGSVDPVGNKWFGTFNRALRNTVGSAVRVRAGDRIRGNWAGPVTFTVPTMQISWNATTKTVRGRCMPNVKYQLVVYRGSSTYSVTGPTNATGMTATATTHDPIEPGDVATLTCARASGDAIRVASAFG